VIFINILGNNSTSCELLSLTTSTSIPSPVLPLITLYHHLPLYRSTQTSQENKLAAALQFSEHTLDLLYGLSSGGTTEMMLDLAFLVVVPLHLQIYLGL